MKTYGELNVTLNGLTPDDFDRLAEPAANGGWARNRAKDEELKRAGGTGVWLTFELTGHKSLPTAFLFLTQKAAGTLYVSNIISLARDRLTYEEYNDILKSFCDAVLVPIQKQNTINFNLTGIDVDLSVQLPKDVYDRLHLFSIAANKKTGSSHPFDQERWMDFLIATDRSKVALDAHTLARWLVEIEGWESDQATRLAEEYEFGRELLQRRLRAS